ncbi:lipopolysaccharide core heptosyltransferase RfaQ [bacterium BMS3Abin04]|nr:lipopolysaccharide core heptosyltransferase RfaQ [bacterium BMS3Abin04]
MKNIELFLRKILLRIILLLHSNRKNQSLPKFDGKTKILFIRLNRIGDALITTPLISEVKNRLNPDIYILSDKKNKFIFHSIIERNKVVTFRKGLPGFLNTLKWINKMNFDVIVDTHDDVSTTVTFLTALSHAPRKFALDKKNRTVYTDTIEKPDSSKVHIVERVVKISELFGIKIKYDNINIIYKPASESIEIADNFIKDNFPTKHYLLGINISAGSEARFWGIERFRKLLNVLSNYKNLDIVVLRSPKDENLAEKITNGKFIIFNDHSFDELAAMISKLDMLFTPDTSAVHLASAFKVPVFGLYVHYNTKDMIWTPYKSKFKAIITEEPTLENLSYNKVVKDFIPFLEENLYEKRNPRL